ncbi:MAG: sigma 54-interacting transcriptional regulator [Thioalkalivibrionaceae bacterium]
MLNEDGVQQTSTSDDRVETLLARGTTRVSVEIVSLESRRSDDSRTSSARVEPAPQQWSEAARQSPVERARVRVTRDASQRAALDSQRKRFDEHFIWPIERDTLRDYLVRVVESVVAAPVQSDVAFGESSYDANLTGGEWARSDQPTSQRLRQRQVGLREPEVAQTVTNHLSRQAPHRSSSGSSVAHKDPIAAVRLRKHPSAAPDWIAQSIAMRRVDALLQLISGASRDVPSDVLLYGPSGAGKEAAARRLHKLWRPDSPFVAVNCAALPETMLEALLFGHARGAFTGALEARRGKFEQASGGLLLLDEITEMPLPLQAKLLRVLQERVVEPLGSVRSVAVDVRVVATTNRDLQAALHGGMLRPDLYYRLAVFPVFLPPLRDRADDIWPLTQRLARAANARLSNDVDLLERLLAHPWPGNVRELANVVARAALLAQGAPITAEHLWFDPVSAAAAPTSDRARRLAEPDVNFTNPGRSAANGRGEDFGVTEEIVAPTDARDPVCPGAGTAGTQEEVRASAPFLTDLDLARKVKQAFLYTPPTVAEASRGDAVSRGSPADRIDLSPIDSEPDAPGPNASVRIASHRSNGLGDRMLAMEYHAVIAALSAYKGRREPAARSLGVSPRTLRHKLARYREAGFSVPTKF